MIFDLLSGSGFVERSKLELGESSFIYSHMKQVAKQIESGFHGYLGIVETLNNRFCLDLRGKETMLDAGSGIGHLAVVLKKTGFNVVGVELDWNDLSVSRAISSQIVHEVDSQTYLINANLACMNNFPDASFALINSSQVLEHIEPHLLFYVFAEFFRLLKPGGILRLDLPDYRAPYEHHYRIPWIPFLNRELSKAWLDGFDRPYGGLEYFYYTSLPQILGLLQSFPFKILSAMTTVSEQEREEQIKRLSGYVDLNSRNYVWIRSGAKRMSQDGVQFNASSMVIVAAKK
jgi:SAM-dependent methyltransferase